MSDPIEAEVATNVAARFQGHPLEPKFTAEIGYDFSPVGHYLTVTMRVLAPKGRKREAVIGITRDMMETEAQKRTGPRPPDLVDWLAPIAGIPTYNEKVSAAVVQVCGEIAERYFKEALRNEIRRLAETVP